MSSKTPNNIQANNTSNEEEYTVLALQQNTIAPFESIDFYICNKNGDNATMIQSVAKLFKAKSNKPYVIVVASIGLDEFHDFFNVPPFSEARERHGCHFASYIQQAKQLREEVVCWAHLFTIEFQNDSSSHPFMDRNGYV